MTGSDLYKQWCGALKDVVVRHPDRRSKPIVRITDGAPPNLYIGLDKGFDTTSDSKKFRSPMAISNVALTFFPGNDLARKWLAAAWFGYCGHESLELVTVGDFVTRPLDPHAEPYVTNACNRSLRDGFPVSLTPETMRATLRLVMDEAEVDKLYEAL